MAGQPAVTLDPLQARLEVLLGSFGFWEVCFSEGEWLRMGYVCLGHVSTMPACTETIITSLNLLGWSRFGWTCGSAQITDPGQSQALTCCIYWAAGWGIAVLGDLLQLGAQLLPKSAGLTVR